MHIHDFYGSALKSALKVVLHPIVTCLGDSKFLNYFDWLASYDRTTIMNTQWSACKRERTRVRLIVRQEQAEPLYNLNLSEF